MSMAPSMNTIGASAVTKVLAYTALSPESWSRPDHKQPQEMMDAPPDVKLMT